MDAQPLRWQKWMLFKCDSLVGIVTHNVLKHLLLREQLTCLTITEQPKARSLMVKVIVYAQVVFAHLTDSILFTSLLFFLHVDVNCNIIPARKDICRNTLLGCFIFCVNIYWLIIIFFFLLLLNLSWLFNYISGVHHVFEVQSFLRTAIFSLPSFRIVNIRPAISDINFSAAVSRFHHILQSLLTGYMSRDQELLVGRKLLPLLFGVVTANPFPCGTLLDECVTCL